MNNLQQEERDLLIRVEQKPELQAYFFQRIKSLKWFNALSDKGFLNADLIPRPVEKELGKFNVPYWPVLDYLVESSKKIPDEKTNEYAEKYIGLIRSYTAYCQEQDMSNFRVWWRLSEVMQSIPQDIVKNQDVELFDYWLDDKFGSDLVWDELAGLLLVWLENPNPDCAEKQISLLQILFQVVEAPSRRNESKTEFIFKAYSHQLDEKIKIIARKAGSVLGDAACRFFMRQLIKVVDLREGDDYSCLWRPAIEDHPQNVLDNDTEDYFILALRESLHALNTSAPDKAAILVSELIHSDKNILKRIGVYTINQFFTEYKDGLFNEVLIAESFGINLKHEMWELILQHFSNFNKEQKKNVFTIVANLKRYNKPDEPDLYHQAEWLAAIKDVDEEAKKKYQSLVEEIGVEPDHPGFSSYISSGWVGRERESPIPLEDLKAIKDKNEIVRLLNDFPAERKFREPDIEGLVGCFRAYVLSEEEEEHRLFENLDAFTNLKIYFLYELVEAYNEIWKEEKCIDFEWDLAWSKLIDFFSSVLNPDSFWSSEPDEVTSSLGRRSWLVSSICRLLESGCKKDDDKRNFSLLHADRVKAVLERILEKQPPVEFDSNADAVSRAINSPRGQAIESLINLVLCESRAADRQIQSHKSIWEKYQPIFDKEFSVKNNAEFFTLVPLYINNFDYLSKEWMDSKFESIFDSLDRLKWLCALQGLSYNGFADPRILSLLKQKGMYERVLDDDLNARADKRYVDYGLTPYLIDQEKLGDENSLIERLLKRNKPEELRQMIWFFRFQLKNHKDYQSKILELFPRIIENIDFETSEGKKLASYLVHWTELIDDLTDQSIGWLKQIARYAEADHNSSDFLKAFARWSEKYPAQTADIWFELLKENPGYPYPEEAFITAFRNFVQSGNKRLASDISDEYLKYNLFRPLDCLRKVLDEVKSV